MFFVKYYTELVQHQSDTLHHTSQAGVFKDTSGSSIIVTPSILPSIIGISGISEESRSIFHEEASREQQQDTSFSFQVTAGSAIALLLSVFLWVDGTHGFSFHELALPGRLNMPPERPPQGQASGAVASRGLNQSLWSSSSGGRRSLISSDSALILSLLRLTSTSHLIAQTLLHPSVCAIPPFPPGASF